MPLPDGFPGAAVVGRRWVGAEPVERRHEPVPQPVRRRRALDVHGEVPQTRLRVHITVMPQVSHDAILDVVRRPSPFLGQSSGLFRLESGEMVGEFLERAAGERGQFSY
jgi:hypothetical protein